MKNRLRFFLVMTALVFFSVMFYPFAVILLIFEPQDLRKIVDKIYVTLVLLNWLNKIKNEI